MKPKPIMHKDIMRKDIMHKDLTTRQVVKQDNNYKPKTLEAKVINYDNDQFMIFLCYATPFYDIIVGCLNINHLRKFRKKNNTKSELIKDSIFGMPVFVYDTFTELKEAKEVYEKMGE